VGAAGHATWFDSARSELAAAKLLKNSGKNGQQAYHHAGQAIEFLLKAIYLKRKNHKELPEACKNARWHSLSLVADEAGLKGDIERIRKTKRKVHQNWLTVRDWQSNGRFPGNRPPTQELNDLFVAVCNDGDGVWQWLEAVYHQI
jgi:HEPN domain-containing protein